jgi:hypothetical protein
MKKNVLMICGSLNQTTIMHQISLHLSDHNCFFTPFYSDGLIDLFANAGMLDFTILGGQHRQNCIHYLQEKNLPIDWSGEGNAYDLVVTGTDLLVQHNIIGKRLVLVQEGMMDDENLAYHLVRALSLPRFLGNTSTTGLSDAYNVFCVASEGYRDLFIRRGVDPEKIQVTGIPNFDHAEKYFRNDFPHHDYVLVATSSNRETLKPENRREFLSTVKRMSEGQQVIFKLHPNENHRRAIREIRAAFPGSLIFTEGDINPMIANCKTLVTTSSSVVFPAVALSKEVISEMDIEEVQQLLPIQNGGKSAEHIADICCDLMDTPVAHLAKTQTLHHRPLAWNIQDMFTNLGI